MKGWSAPVMAALLLAGCGRSETNDAGNASGEGAASVEGEIHSSTAAVAPDSAQAAAAVVERYYALLGARNHGEAWLLWGDEGRASGVSREQFAGGFARYESLQADVGAPGEIEGAAGSLYVEVPVQVYGRRSGRPFRTPGTVVLRRVNDVPGSSEAQRRWHIERIMMEEQA